MNLSLARYNETLFLRKKLKFEIRQRTNDELEFEDEVDYPANVSLRDKFKKYKGLKSFKTSEWKKYV